MFFFNELEVGTEIMFHADEVNSLSKSLGVGSGPRRLICACLDATICLVPRSANPQGTERIGFNLGLAGGICMAKETKSL